mgnify:CR=1 FL=1
MRRGGRCDTINKKGGLDMDYQKSFKILKNGVLWGAFIFMLGLGMGVCEHTVPAVIATVLGPGLMPGAALLPLSPLRLSFWRSKNDSGHRRRQKPAAALPGMRREAGKRGGGKEWAIKEATRFCILACCGLFCWCCVQYRSMLLWLRLGALPSGW